MEQIVTKINIDLYNPTSYEVIKAQQGDDSRWIKVYVKNDGNPYEIPSGAKITFEGTRSDSSSFCIDNVLYDADESSILFNIYQAINIHGISVGKIVIRDINDDDNVERLSSIPITISVQKDAYDKEKEEQANITAIDYLFNSVEKLSDAFDKYEVVDENEPTDKTITKYWLETY